MGQQQSNSKDELVYQQVVENNVEAIKALCREGAGLEWMDKEGKTPLIVACMDPRLYIVAKTLIELGANVNAFRPGRHAGTPLHHAAKRGLDQTVRMLLSSGANAFVRNDDCQTPLDVARAKGYQNVVRAIEEHLCYFSGHVREILAPGFLEALAPQLLSRKSWVVVVPSTPSTPVRPPKLELAIYPTAQNAEPRAVIPLWKSKIEDPKFNQSDPVLIVHDQTTKTRYKFASAIEGNKEQIRRLYNACKGISQVMPSPLLSSEAGASASSLSMTTQPALSANNNGWGRDTTGGPDHNGWGPQSQPSSGPQSQPPPGSSVASGSNGWITENTSDKYNGWGLPNSSLLSDHVPSTAIQPNTSLISQSTTCLPGPSSSSVPSAPPLPDDTDGHIHYPTIDSSPVDLSIPVVNNEAPAKNVASGEKSDDSSSCSICWENPVEGACIPCGHMAGCMSCLNEIKTKKGDCPVCRAKINQTLSQSKDQELLRNLLISIDHVFLAGLNQEYDQVRIQVLGTKPLTSVEEIVGIFGWRKPREA